MSVVRGIEGVAGPDRTPSSEVATRELLQEARRRLSPEERSLLERREQGREWTEIAAELGSSPEAIRKRSLALSTAWLTSWDWTSRTDERDQTAVNQPHAPGSPPCRIRSCSGEPAPSTPL